MCGYGSCGVSCASGVEREGAVLQGRETSSSPRSSPASTCLGEEEDPWCRLKRHRFAFFFYEQYMK